jgi:hypothetical protein
MTKGLSVTEKAIVILQKTNDGNDLDPSDLALVQAAVNRHVTPDGAKAFDVLYASVEDGSYKRPWFHGQENMLIDHEGYVYWKGSRIEHFSPEYAYTRDAGKQAVELSRRCKILEERGVVPTIGEVIWKWEEKDDVNNTK